MRADRLLASSRALVQVWTQADPKSLLAITTFTDETLLQKTGLKTPLTLETSAGTTGLEKPDHELKESGYDGRTVVFMQPSDLSANFNATVVVADPQPYLDKVLDDLQELRGCIADYRFYLHSRPLVLRRRLVLRLERLLGRGMFNAEQPRRRSGAIGLRAGGGTPARSTRLWFHALDGRQDIAVATQ